jgi:hypothetical protein
MDKCYCPKNEIEGAIIFGIFGKLSENNYGQFSKNYLVSMVIFEKKECESREQIKELKRYFKFIYQSIIILPKKFSVLRIF